MALNLNSSRALRKHSELVALVEAIRDADPTDELEWLEWKSQLDLTSRADQFIVAKQVLGFSNRDPNRAARAVDGLGYVVIGAEPQRLSGVTPVDPAALEPALEQYVGSEPVWAGRYVKVDGIDVLIVTVEAPKWGDRMHTLKRSFQDQGGKGGADAGTIFVRKQGRTVRASDADIVMLENRLLHGARASSLALDVGRRSEAPLAAVDLSQTSLDEWVNERRAWVLGMRPQPLAVGTDSGEPQTRLAGLLGQLSTPESRTRDEYEAEVESHLEQCRDALVQGCARRIVDAGTNAVDMTITNTTTRNLPDVQLVLTTDAPALAIKDDLELSDGLPAPPRAFGSPSNAGHRWGKLDVLGDTGVQSVTMPSRLALPDLSPWRGIDVQPGPPLRVTLDIGHLRPQATVEAPTFHLIVVKPGSGDTVEIQWNATSTGVDAQQHGVLSLPIQHPDLSPAEMIPPTSGAEE